MDDARRAHNVHGVAGALIDLLDVPPQLIVAVEVVAKNQLFQVGFQDFCRLRFDWGFCA